MFWMFLNSPHLRGSWWKTKDIWSLTVSLYLSFPFCSSRSSRKPGVSVPLFPDWLGLRLCHFLLLPHLMVYLPFMIKRNQEEKLASPLRNKTRRQLKVFAIFVPAYEAGAPRIGNILGHIINFHLSGTNDQKSFFFFWESFLMEGGEKKHWSQKYLWPRRMQVWGVTEINLAHFLLKIQNGRDVLVKVLFSPLDSDTVWDQPYSFICL